MKTRRVVFYLCVHASDIRVLIFTYLHHSVIVNGRLYCQVSNLCVQFVMFIISFPKSKTPSLFDRVSQ